MLKQNQFSKTRRNSSLELVQRQLVSYSKYSKLEYSNYKKYISDHGFGIFMRMGAEMAARPRSLSCGDLFLVWVCWDSSRCHCVCQTLCHISGWPNWWSAPARRTDRQHGVSAAEGSQTSGLLTYHCVSLDIQRCRGLVNRAGWYLRELLRQMGLLNIEHSSPFGAPSTHYSSQLRANTTAGP